MYDQKKSDRDYEERPYPITVDVKNALKYDGHRIFETREDYFLFHCKQIKDGGYTSAIFVMSADQCATDHRHFSVIKEGLLDQSHHLRSLTINSIPPEIREMKDEGGKKKDGVIENIVKPIQQNSRQLSTLILNGQQRHQDWVNLPIEAQPPAPNSGCCAIL